MDKAGAEQGLFSIRVQDLEHLAMSRSIRVILHA